MTDDTGEKPAAAEAAGSGATVTSSEARPGSRRRGLLALLGTLVLLGGAGTGWVLLRPQAETGPETFAAEAAEGGVEAQAGASEPTLPPGIVDGVDFNAELGIELPDVAADEKKDAAHGAERGAASPGHLGKIVSLEPFVVNIADRERDRFLKLKTDIELSSAEVGAELEQRMPQIRDLIISLLGAKSFDEVRSIEGKNFLREEMLLRINSLLVTGKAKAIYFTEFVVQ